jgi:hypothetical protein
LAEAKLASGDAAGALAIVAPLVEYFGQQGQRESELRALAIAIAASRGPEHARYLESGTACLAKLRELLGDDFGGFVARPDIHQIVQHAGLTSAIK